MTDPEGVQARARHRGAATGSITPRAGESRIGPLITLPRVLQELGGSPQQAFRQADIPLSLFDDPENPISQESLCNLLSLCTTLTGRSDFGLLVGERFSLRDFGALGELMRNSATVGKAVRMLLLHLHFYDRAAIPVLFRAGTTSAFLGYALRHPAMAGVGQLQDAAMAVGYRMLRELCGPGWRPRLVQFSHRRPGNLMSHRRLFGPAVRFDAELSGLTFAASWLEHRIAGADPALFSVLHRALQDAEKGWPIGVAEEVQCVLHQLLPGGAMSSASVAQMFGFSERTLRQKLRAEGTSMRQLLTQTRFELARHLLQGTELPISHVAAALCYADTAVFSRAFHGWAGMSPRQWRTGNRKQ